MKTQELLAVTTILSGLMSGFFFAYTFSITAIRNVPLNNQIELFDISKASEESVQKMRATFEKPWLFWNNIRTLASFVTFACLVIALACLNH